MAASVRFPTYGDRASRRLAGGWRRPCRRPVRSGRGTDGLDGALPEVEQARTQTEVTALIRPARRPVEVPAGMLSEGVSKRNIEIMHCDLTKIVYEANSGHVEYGSDDFELGGCRTFDLLVGADGLHSITCRLVFGPEESFLRFRRLPGDLGWEGAAPARRVGTGPGPLLHQPGGDGRLDERTGGVGRRLRLLTRRGGRRLQPGDHRGLHPSPANQSGPAAITFGASPQEALEPVVRDSRCGRSPTNSLSRAQDPRRHQRCVGRLVHRSILIDWGYRPSGQQRRRGTSRNVGTAHHG